jgi:hypothetical protein
MVLCEVCQKLDVREFLQVSLDCKKRPLPATTELIVLGSQVDYEVDDDGLSVYLRHHESALALQESSQNGCDLCTVIWEEFSFRNPHESDDLNHWGQVYISSNRATFGGPKPLLEVTSSNIEGQPCICEWRVEA